MKGHSPFSSIIKTLPAALIALLLWADLSEAAESKGSRTPAIKWYKPHFLTTQTGGYVGLFTAGMGYRLSKHWDTEFIYGYVPESVGGEDLHQATWKNSLHPFQYKIKRNNKIVASFSVFYFGVSIIYGFDDDLFIVLPERYPKDYYTPSAVHSTVNLGISARYHRHGLFVEAVASNIGLNAVYENPGHFSAGDIISYAAGYRYYLR